MMIGHFLCRASLLFAISLPRLFAGQPDSDFEGRIDYEIDNGGQLWSYSVWLKGDRWRTELRSDEQVYEVRLGNAGNGEVYLVNDIGESYRDLGKGFMSDGRASRRGPDRDQAPKPLLLGELSNLEELVETEKVSKSVLGMDVRLDQLKGPGKEVHVRLASGLGRFPGIAMPRFKALEQKAPLFVAYFKRFEGAPLEVEILEAKEKKAFSMRAVKIERAEVDESFVSLPKGYIRESDYGPGERRGGPPPG